jgi:hypothetical protein
VPAKRTYIAHMTSARSIEITLLPGAEQLLARHASVLPQRDDLCGAFCGALALHAAGVRGPEGQPLDQDDVALAAGSVVSGARDAGTLPHAEAGRRDYRLQLPSVEDASVSGTTAAGLVDALASISAGRVAPIPLAGPWTVEALNGLFALAAAMERPVTLVANLATRHLWGARAGVPVLIAYLLGGEGEGPAPDWDVGHFACVVGRIMGPRGSLYVLADTYPALGASGIHLQPPDRLAAAIDRPDMPAGGVISVVAAEDAPALRAGAAGLGLREEIWDNGTVTAEAPA